MSARRVRWPESLFGALALTALIGAPACAFQDDTPSTVAGAAAAAQAGRYDDALRAYDRLAAQAAGDAERVAITRALVRVMVEAGRYDDAIALAGQWAADSTLLRAAALPLGDAYRRRGRATDAGRLYAVAARGTPDSLAARLALADLALAQGDLAAADDGYEAVLGAYRATGGRLTSAELAAVGVAAWRQGRDDPQAFRDALRVLDQAVAADSANLAARVALGELFLEKYNTPDAATTLDAVLAVNPHHPDALLALARLRQADGAPGAMQLVERALVANRNHAAARAFRARLLFELEDLVAAERDAAQALTVEPGHPEALAVQAAARHLRLDRDAAAAGAAQVAGGAPRQAEYYLTLAELSARNRLYADAATFARQAVQLDAANARARAQLGVNLLRTGDMAEAREALDAAFARDPYDVWTKNTLDLLDATASYREVSTPNFRIVLDSREADLLGPLAAELAEEAYARFAVRYDWRPAGPVRLELYPRHADFSVRTVGLAGLGALGVSFGGVVAMDSPAARDAGAFNWGSTLWHEVAHTFTLGASGHRVPRWLSEGLSVYEERRARPGWGMDASPGFVAAYAAGGVPVPSRLNDGFMRPAYPEQIGYAYVAASLVCEYIEARHGADALPRLLRAYRDGRTTEEAFREVLGVMPDVLDRDYDAWFRERYTTQLAAVRGGAAGDSAGVPAVGGRFAEAMQAGMRALQSGDDDAALRELERARELFPEVGGADSPHALLAVLHERRGDTRRAADELAALTAVDEDNHAANVKLAELRLQLGDSTAAAEALERTLWTSPYDASLHARLAELHAALGEPRKAVRARQAVLALGPADEAEARYRLARAHRDAGDVPAARREVLRALELAPAFEAAQTLLLDLRGSGGPP